MTQFINCLSLFKTQNICTHTVSMAIAALRATVTMYHKPNEGQKPEKAQVLISSLNGCRAFNCYNRTFEMNGSHSHYRGMSPNKNFSDTGQSVVRQQHSPAF